MVLLLCLFNSTFKFKFLNHFPFTCFIRLYFSKFNFPADLFFNFFKYFIVQMEFSWVHLKLYVVLVFLDCHSPRRIRLCKSSNSLVLFEVGRKQSVPIVKPLHLTKLKEKVMLLYSSCKLAMICSRFTISSSAQ